MVASVLRGVNERGVRANLAFWSCSNSQPLPNAERTTWLSAPRQSKVGYQDIDSHPRPVLQFCFQLATLCSHLQDGIPTQSRRMNIVFHPT